MYKKFPFLQATLRKLQKEDMAKVSEDCMKALLGMLNMSKVGGVQEDAFMAVGTLVECMNLFFDFCHLFGYSEEKDGFFKPSFTNYIHTLC